MTQRTGGTDLVSALSGAMTEKSEKTTADDLQASFQSYIAKGSTENYRTAGQTAEIRTTSDHKDVYKKETAESASIQKQQLRDSLKQEDDLPADAVREPDTESLQEDIRETVKDELDMTDEELDTVLESMNLSVLDLLQPECMQELLLTAAEAEPVELLTNSALVDTLTQLEDSMAELAQTAGLDADDVTALTAELAQTAAEPKDAATETPETELLPDTVLTADTEVTLAETPEQPETANTEKGGLAAADTGSQLSDTKTDGIAVEIRTQDSGAESNSGQERQATADPQTVAGEVVNQLSQAVSELEETPASFRSEVQQSEILRQVVEQIRVTMGSDTSSMEVQLYPQHLGRVQIQVMMKNGVMTAQINAETEAAKEAIETQLQQLKEAFQEKSIQVESVEVSVSTAAFQQNQQRQDTAQDSQRSRSGRRIRTDGYGSAEEAAEEAEADERLAAHGASVEFTA